MSNYKKNIYKVVLIGDPCVGKTSLANRISRHSFNSHYKATSGFDMCNTEIEIDNRTVTLNIVDTAGQERFNSMTHNFYRGANAVILCFDITNSFSFESIDKWKSDFIISANPKQPSQYPFILCGTKIDLENRQVESSMALRWCNLNSKVPYLETSAKNDTGVTQLFETVARQIISRLPKDNFHAPEMPEMIEIDQTTPRSSSCCYF